MTIQLKITTTRPSVDIPWSDEPDHTPDTVKYWYLTDSHYMEFWHEKGKLLSSTHTSSEDGLSIITVREFLNWDALDEFIADAQLAPIRHIRNVYHDAVGIEITDMETVEI